MKLKLTRSQRTSMTRKLIYRLDVLVEVSGDEKDLIKKYKLGDQIVYSSESFNRLAAGAGAAQDAAGGMFSTPTASGMLNKATAVGLSWAAAFALKLTVDDMIKGKPIECKDLGEMLDAENAVITGAQNIKTFLDAAETFDGREVVVEL